MVIVERSSGRLIGRTGLAWLADITETADVQDAELGWTLAREAWGYGYAIEAAHAMATWAFAPSA